MGNLLLALLENERLVSRKHAAQHGMQPTGFASLRSARLRLMLALNETYVPGLAAQSGVESCLVSIE